MLQQCEGSRAVAQAVALCRPQVVCAYPISPQTHIIEALSVAVSDGSLTPCEFINVDSEFSAMSATIGASAAGSRAYTATSSQGLLFMAEAVFNAAGLGLPIVMTLATRAIGAPINIWNDHSDAMALRDCGFVQLHAQSNQEAVDLHLQAFRLAEAVSLPVMVCMDGFLLTHATERVDIPAQADVDAFVPPFAARQVLDPEEPISIGAMVGPDAFMEVRHLAQRQHDETLHLIPDIAAEFEQRFGRRSGGLIDAYRCDDAAIVVVAMGSLVGTLKDAVDEARGRGISVGVVGITTYRPFPQAAIVEELADASTVIVMDKAMAAGIGGVVVNDIRAAMAGRIPAIHSVIAGLGGRPIFRRQLVEVISTAAQGELPATTFLDLNEAALAGVETTAAAVPNGTRP